MTGEEAAQAIMLFSAQRWLQTRFIVPTSIDEQTVPHASYGPVMRDASVVDGRQSVDSKQKETGHRLLTAHMHTLALC